MEPSDDAQHEQLSAGDFATGVTKPVNEPESQSQPLSHLADDKIPRVGGDEDIHDAPDQNKLDHVDLAQQQKPEEGSERQSGTMSGNSQVLIKKENSDGPEQQQNLDHTLADTEHMSAIEDSTQAPDVRGASLINEQEPSSNRPEHQDEEMVKNERPSEHSDRVQGVFERLQALYTTCPPTMRQPGTPLGDLPQLQAVHSRPVEQHNIGSQSSHQFPIFNGSGGDPANSHQAAVDDQQNMQVPLPGYFHNQTPRQHPRAFSPQYGHKAPPSASMSPGTRASGSPSNIPGTANLGQGKSSRKKRVVEDTLSSDDKSSDDEPLKSRTQRHPSVLSQQQDDGSPGSDDLSHLFDKRAPMSRPLPDISQYPNAHPNDDEEEDSDDDPTKISWKPLPKYDVFTETGEEGEAIAKVSLPGLVREELALSPDHSAQEIHLLLNLFLPGQQALETNDPEPALALLNFHTVALMVIEAFVQYEIGDEFTRVSRRRHGHSGYDYDDDDEEDDAPRIRHAQDADMDEIFFAVVDRWRAGMAFNEKKSYALIRGVQEFCDIALDVIYYIHEYGLLPQQKEPKNKKGGKKETSKGGKKAAAAGAKGKKGEANRKAANDKGKKQASKAKKLDDDDKEKEEDDDDDEPVVRGKRKADVKKRTTTPSKGKVATLQPRKKQKVKPQLTVTRVPRSSAYE